MGLRRVNEIIIDEFALKRMDERRKAFNDGVLNLLIRKDDGKAVHGKVFILLMNCLMAVWVDLLSLLEIPATMDTITPFLSLLRIRKPLKPKSATLVSLVDSIGARV